MNPLTTNNQQSKIQDAREDFARKIQTAAGVGEMQVNNAQIKTQTSIEFQKDIRHSHCDSKNSRGESEYHYIEDSQLVFPMNEIPE